MTIRYGVRAVRYGIRGLVASSPPVAGLRVVAVDDVDRPNAVLSAVTQSDGSFSIVLTIDDLIRLFRTGAERGPGFAGKTRTLYFTVYNGNVAIAAQSDDVALGDLLESSAYVEIDVENTTVGDAQRGYFARGRVLEPDGTPVEPAVVSVVRQDMRSEVSLVSVNTDSDGRFIAAYTADTTDAAPAGPPFAIYLLAEDTGQQELGRTEVYCHAPADLEVDIVVGNVPLRGPARSTELDDALEPLRGSVELHELTVDDVEHLACVTQHSIVDIAQLARSAQLANTYGISRDAFFAFAQAGLPTTMSGVVAQSREAQEAALVHAENTNIVPPWGTGEIDQILDDLEAALIEQTVPTNDPGSSLLGGLLLTGGVASSLPREFIEEYLARTGTTEEFWDDFRTAHGATDTETVQFTLGIGALTGDHFPLIDSLQAMRTATTISGARELARLTASDWLTILTTGSPGPGAPAAIPGADENERNTNYSVTLARAFEDAFPTEAVAGALERATALPQVVGFISLNPTFDLGSTRITEYLSGSPTLPGGDNDDLARDLLHVQRLHMIAPRLGRSDAVATLLSAGVFSAQHVYKMGWAAFNQQFEPSLGATGVALVWGAAAQQSAKVASLVAQHATPFNVPTIYAIPYFSVSTEDGFPDIETLFGAQGFCACEHCRSVYGPAAYLTDLLKFLRDRPASTASTLLDVVDARRPDIVQILLNCDNSHTVMPTIDIVNEILERRVSPSPAPPWPQTTWTEAELRAHPEHLHLDAYDELAAAVHPWTLPFDLLLEESRLYLDHLGVRLADLFEILRGHDAAEAHAIALETLRLSALQGEIVQNEVDYSQAPYSNVGAPWGLSGAWDTALADDVRLFLSQASMTYQELLELLHCEYPCDPAGSVTIEFSESNPCSLDAATFDGWTTTKLGRVHRFVRLARRIGWPLLELDAATRALGTETDALEAASSGVEPTFVGRLAAVTRLLERWPRMGRLEVLSWFGLLDTHRGRHDVPSFYDTVFLDRTVDPNNTAFDVADGATELTTTAALDLETDGPVIQAALNITEEDLGAMLSPGPHGSAITQRDLASLSQLHRRASLSRALGLPIVDLLLLISLSGDEPFDDDGSPTPDVEQTRAFIERVDRVRASRFSLAELDYLLRHQFDPNEGIALLTERSHEVFIELIRGLQNIETETSRATDAATPSLTILGDRLGAVLDEAFVQPTLLAIQGEPHGISPEQDLLDQLERFLSPADAALLLEDPESTSPPQTVEERADDTLESLLDHIRLTQMSTLVIQKLSTAVGIDNAAGELLLRARDIAPDDDGVTVFLQDAFVRSVDFEADAEAIRDAGFPTLSPADTLQDHFETLEWLSKAAMVVQRFRLSPQRVQWLLDEASSLGLLDLLALPLDEVSAAAPLWATWERLARVIAVRDAFFGAPALLFDLLATATDDAGVLDATGQAQLVEATGWDATELATLVTALDIDAASVQAIDGIERLARAFGMLRRLGIAADRAVAWATTTVDAATAQAIKNATRSKHSADAWPQVIGPLRDRLREQQRDALVAFVLADNASLDNAEDLLGEVLIDVLGESCQRTSRIVQASASIQLFVQRLSLNLEAPDALDDASAREWSWRRYYRVWEANRKVFLYPENYVEPDLRDEQSPFFRQLTSELLEGELTEDKIQEAFAGYLRRIQDVSRLHAAGVYHEIEYDESAQQVVLDVLHVFARSPSAPYRYFYRRRVNDSYWTAWEPVPLNIEHPAVMPVVLNRRLLLMWPTITPAAAQSGETQREFLEIRLSLSEFTDGEWTQPEISEDVVTTDRHTIPVVPEAGGAPHSFREQPRPSTVFFETVQDGTGDLRVQPLYGSSTVSGPGFSGPFGAVPGLVLSGYVTAESAFYITGRDRKIQVVDAEDEFRHVNDPDEHPRPNQTVPQYQSFAHPRSTFEDDSITRDVHLFQRHVSDPQQVVGLPRLIEAASPFEVLAPRHNTRGNPEVRFLCEDPFFYHDDHRSFFVLPRDPGQYGLPTPYDGDGLDVSGVDGFNYLLYVDPGQIEFTSETPPPTYDATITAPDYDEDAYEPSGWQHKRFWFFTFQHPFINRMLSIVEEEGVAGLLDPAVDGANADLRHQALDEAVMDQTAGRYLPNPDLVRVRPRDRFDFDHHGAYSLYNWEIFFHAPLLIAQRLHVDQQFELAQKWLHYVFDPTESSSDPAPQRFWKPKPFFEASQQTPIADQLEALSYSGTDHEQLELRENLEGQIAQWKANPFNPHLLARLRPVAYQRATVMKYLDNLIAWGDHLFRQDTRETVGEALQLYQLASLLLGAPPDRLEARTPDDRSFDDLSADLDAFSNALVEMENLVPVQFKYNGEIAFAANVGQTDHIQQPGGGAYFQALPPANPFGSPKAFQIAAPAIDTDLLLTNLTATMAVNPDPGDPRVLYFCVPPNDKLLGYWDTVADRLFKIRNCLNIEGIRRDLPLFEPPIDPALLVRATAAGIDLASAISALNTPRPHYRFRTMIPVAKELAAEVRALGQALLTALERRDAEHLAELRATHEVRTLEATHRVLEQRVAEARQNIAALQAARVVAEERRVHYDNLLTESRDDFFAPARFEFEVFRLSEQIVSDHHHALLANKFAGRMGKIPDIGISFGFPSVSISTTFGGSFLANISYSKARGFTDQATEKSAMSSALSTTASQARRAQDWNLQRAQAEAEIDRIDEEILAAEIRLDVARRELTNQQNETARAREREQFLRQRFSRSDLYGWMSAEVSRVYHQAYQLAYDIAKRAERTYQFELAAEDTSFIQFGYWDNQRKGLLAGDKLLHDIRRMDTSYLHDNRRELEMNKSVSLAMLDPVALVILRETGTCFLEIPEVLFDLDHPGHFLRRLKSVSVSVASKTGPFAEVPLTLTLVSSAIRRSPSLQDDPIDDLTSGIEQISTMSAEDDDGLFERNFNDERYLPFEGRGAFGTWRIELPPDYHRFDYTAISDVVLRLSYTARQGGDAFRSAVTAQIATAIADYEREESYGDGLVNALSARRVFPDDFDRFLNPGQGEDATMTLDVSASRFPLRFHGGGQEIRINAIRIIALFESELPGTDMEVDLELPDTSSTTSVSALTLASQFTGVARAGFGDAPGSPPSFSPQVTTGSWEVALTGGGSPPATLQDLIIVMEYEVVTPT